MSFSQDEKINLVLKKALNIVQTSNEEYYGLEIIKEKKYVQPNTILKHDIPTYSDIQNYYVIGIDGKLVKWNGGIATVSKLINDSYINDIDTIQDLQFFIGSFNNKNNSDNNKNKEIFAFYKYNQLTSPLTFNTDNRSDYMFLNYTQSNGSPILDMNWQSFNTTKQQQLKEYKGLYIIDNNSAVFSLKKAITQSKKLKLTKEDLQNYYHPFLKLYVMVPTILIQNTGTSNYSFYNPIIEKSLASDLDYPFAIYNYNNNKFHKLNLSSDKNDIIFTSYSGVITDYSPDEGDGENNLNPLYPPLMTYLKYEGPTFDTNVILKGLTPISNASNNDLFLDISNDILKFYKDNKWENVTDEYGNYGNNFFKINNLDISSQIIFGDAKLFLTNKNIDQEHSYSQADTGISISASSNMEKSYNIIMPIIHDYSRNSSTSFVGNFDSSADKNNQYLLKIYFSKNYYYQENYSSDQGATNDYNLKYSSTNYGLRYGDYNDGNPKYIEGEEIFPYQYQTTWGRTYPPIETHTKDIPGLRKNVPSDDFYLRLSPIKVNTGSVGRPEYWRQNDKTIIYDWTYLRYEETNNIKIDWSQFNYGNKPPDNYKNEGGSGWEVTADEFDILEHTYEYFRGSKGEKGDGRDGFKGYKGEKGGVREGTNEKGERGDRYILDASKGEVGDFLKGDKGYKGERGDFLKGIKGKKGDRIADDFVLVDGDKGFKGYKGFKGEVNIKGSIGDTNVVGSKGDIGNRGDIGIKGMVAMYNGIKGEKGNINKGNLGDFLFNTNNFQFDNNNIIINNKYGDSRGLLDVQGIGVVKLPTCVKANPHNRIGIGFNNAFKYSNKGKIYKMNAIKNFIGKKAENYKGKRKVKIFHEKDELDYYKLFFFDKNTNKKYIT